MGFKQLTRYKTLALKVLHIRLSIKTNSSTCSHKLDSAMETLIESHGQNQKETVAGASVAIMNARLIFQQEAIPSIKEISKLPTHQQAAKDQSHKLIEEIWPLVLKTTTDIIDYANTYQATYSQLSALIPELKSGSTKAKEEVLSAVKQVLLQALHDNFSSGKAFTTTIQKFHDDFQPLFDDFKLDFVAANQIMTEDNEKIAEKQKELCEWKEKATKYQIAYTAAAVAMPITVATTYFFSETGVAVLFGGILFAGEVATLATMLTLYADAMHHVHQLTYEISILHKQVAELTLIEHQISGLHKNTEHCVTSTTKLVDGWAGLQKNLESIVELIEEASTEDAVSIIENQLSAANEKWGVVLKQAKALQPSGGQLEQKTFDTPADMLKAIDNLAPKVLHSQPHRKNCLYL